MNDIPAIQVSVIDPVGKALEKTKEILFSPFDLAKWFTIGFCAWLAFLGEGGGGGGGGRGGDGISNTGSNAMSELQHIRHAIEANLYWIIPVGAVVLFFAIAIGLVIVWVRCRGKFMFLYCVAKNKAEVSYPWTEYGRQANSLFLFKIALSLIGMVCFIPIIVGWIIVVILPMVNAKQFLPALIGMIILLGAVTLLVAIVFGLIAKFTEDFVVPAMFISRIRCMEAWKQVWGLVKANFGRFVLFILFTFVINMAIGAVIIAVGLATCGCACCFMSLPYIGTVLLLPILVFQRAYSTLYLAQYGPKWDVFAKPQQTSAVFAENVE